MRPPGPGIYTIPYRYRIYPRSRSAHEDFVVVGVVEDARQGNILVGLFGGEECTLFVEMPVVEVEGCDDMQENKEFLAGRGR